MVKIILSLFDYSGVWSQPYKEAGFKVLQVDIQHGIDILKWEYWKQFYPGDVYGLLISEPCDNYALSGARWFSEKDRDGRTAYSQKLVAKTKEIKDYYSPLVFWVLENPMSRIHTLNPWLGPVKYKFHPYEFAGHSGHEDCYTKQTWLWGVFNEPIKKKHCDDINKTKIWYQAPGPDRKNIRSRTPEGFARAFFESNSF